MEQTNQLTKGTLCLAVSLSLSLYIYIYICVVALLPFQGIVGEEYLLYVSGDFGVYRSLRTVDSQGRPSASDSEKGDKP